jgi:hypothetical protein
MRRREFMMLMGGAAALSPHEALAQQAKMPAIGFLNAGSPEQQTLNVNAFRVRDSRMK